MKYEFDLLKGGVTPAVRRASRRLSDIEIMAARKAVNLVAKKLVHEGLLSNSLPLAQQYSAELMVAIATNLLKFGEEPTVEDFVFACSELVSNTRITLDHALKKEDMSNTKIASVMMEIVVRGIFATLSRSYEDTFEAAVRAARSSEHV